MILQRRLLAMLFVLFAIGDAGLVNGDLVVYTDRSEWESAVSGLTTGTETFENAPLGPLVAGANDYTFFTATLDFNDSEYTAIVDSGAVNGTRDFRARISTNNPADPSGIGIHLNLAVLAMGADFDGTTDDDVLTMDVLGETIVFSEYLSSPGTGFLGVVSTEEFDLLEFKTNSPSNSGQAFSIDNVSFAVNAVPEPGGGLIVSLAILIGWMRTRRRNMIR